ncbi:diguanylate cyclase domain-containing protein [Rhizobium sp. P28RR-XV]|uniref:GGDEF domain-containing protein n=1 Tax=Rhizobium sp. P28RR-XV TaxID=2726737 RepID=UPI001FEE2808|nr:diguanylate cyclase [Rhizobium sp. P28RR-XV]
MVPDNHPKAVRSGKQRCKAINFTGFLKPVLSGLCLAYTELQNGDNSDMILQRRHPSATIVKVLWRAMLGALCAVVGSVGLVLVLNLLMPDRPFLVGFVGAALISAFVAFPLLFALQLKNGVVRNMQENATQAARYDSVTKTLNGTAFAAAVEHFVDRRKHSAADAGGIVIAVIVDTLDDIGRRYGLQWADTVMQSLASIIQSSVRRGDLVARLATNELGIFLPGATIENAHDIGTRIRAGVSAATFSADGAPLSFAIRLGGISFDGPADFTHLRQLADQMAFENDDESDGFPISVLPAA